MTPWHDSRPLSTVEYDDAEERLGRRCNPERILEPRFIRSDKVIEYLVMCKGCGPKDDKWKHEHELQSLLDLVEYKRAN